MDTLLDNPIIWVAFWLIVLAIGLWLLPRDIVMVLLLIAGFITLVVGIIMFIARLAGKDI